MYQHSLIVRTKLAPPRPQKYTLPRPRLTQRLLEARDYRLTIVQAGTGYGKSTALAALAGEPLFLIWYRLDAEDRDPQRFLTHLLHGFAAALPGLSDAPLAVLEEWSGNRAVMPWTAVVDSLINECARAIPPGHPLFLALDDVHQLQHTGDSILILDRLTGLAPDNLHIILATRHPITMPTLLNWRVKGEVLEIEQAELAFTPVEIDALFRTRYGHDLTLEQAALLVEKLEGWPIALQLVWKNLQKDNGATFAEAVAQLSGSTGDLFTYLTQEVLAQQPPDIQVFLRLTSVLRQMTAVRCDYLRHAHDSQQILSYLLENGLFVVDAGEGQVRYHRLFRELLTQQLAPGEAQVAHRRAAGYAQKHGEEETAVYHWFQASAFEEAALLLSALGQEMLRVGRLDTLAGWIGALPADTLANHPALLTYLGDIARLHSRFEAALGWYQQAEQRSRLLNNIPALGQALRGQARVYLDTVNPNQAAQLLQEALRLADGQDDRESRARLNELLSENLLNLGRAEEAQQYQVQVRELRQEGPSQVELPVRILLRTGRLAEARRLLEEQAEKERREPVLRPRAHRETLLLLSLILAYQGEQELAMQTAVEGTERGRALHSDFVTAVGYMRQGHAWTLLKNETGYHQAVRCHEEAIRFSDKLDVPRLKVEASWGLCQAHGFRGDLDTANQVATQGIEIARSAGDEWIEAGIRVVMGAAYVLANRYNEAAAWLAQANTGFRACGDPYGEAVTRLWQCLLWHQTGDHARLERDIGILLKLCQMHGYEMLFLRPTFLGPPDIHMLAPLLLFARESGLESATAENLLAQLGLPDLELHPGYQLRVQTLGAFQLWRGVEEVPHREWQRKKALQLFLLFLTHRGQVLHREQICDLLWPEMNPDDAARDFKIAYSAMCAVLEPARKRHAPSAYILRKGVRYGLRPEADLWLDAAEFERLLAQADRLFKRDPATAVSLYRQALALYDGDYLQAYPYYDWASAEQERLLTLYLRSSERLAQALAAQAAWAEVATVCQAILSHDDCWEEAYRLLMLAYDGLGNRAQALQTYERCRETLQRKWGVEPMPDTVQIYEGIRQSSP
ncbi:MAG TPA: BTAD domain-containing putative transcriptional regulator [Chloroflexota bacterium]|nr:BTAD domain-containing putative transcriptional regulator [Chloroflexota bacterium]